jgi:uncharacterized protein YutE (UPF0331/DUF86 family)
MDEKKILAKIDELNGYLEELEKIKPNEFKGYESSIEKKRACERLLQVSIESVIDVCNVLVSGLKLGIPDDEDALFAKLEKKKIISKKMLITLGEMKGFRNILVHKYGKVDDELVFENLDKLGDFDKFKDEILSFLRKN